MKENKSLSEPNDVLYRIKRGLAGYVSYLAACEMNESFSEYVLYEPILRVLTARGYKVQCEVVCPGIEQPPVGDKKKLDFVATLNNLTFALEVKWAKSERPKIDEDLRKLAACRQEKSWQAFLCVFGTKSSIAKIQLPMSLKERGDPVIAEFGKTRFGCRVYELTEQTAALKGGGAPAVTASVN
jgi:Holliday junction resolvase